MHTLDSVLTNNVDAWEYALKAVVVVTVTFNVMVEISQLIRGGMRTLDEIHIVYNN